MAVMYSKLRGCLGVTTKLGPLARTDLCAGVKGLLERLMTHFGLGSSKEDPWWSLLGGRCRVAFQGISVVCLGGSTVPLGGLGDPMPDWAPGSLPAWHLVVSWLPAWLEGRLLPAWEGLSLPGVLVVTSLPAWDEALSLGVLLGLTALPAWEEALSWGRGGNCLSCCLPACLRSC